MKDIINLNAQETNIAIVWAVLLIFTVITQLFLLSVINFNVVLCVYGLLPAMHLFWRKDIFAPLKQKYPFGVTLFAFVGRLFRWWILFHILAIIFMLALKDELFKYFGLKVRIRNERHHQPKRQRNEYCDCRGCIAYIYSVIH